MNTNELNQVTETSENTDNQLPKEETNTPSHFELSENDQLFQREILDRIDLYEKKDNEQEFIKLTMWETEVEIFVRHKDIVSLIPTSDQINGEPPKSYTYVDLKGGHDDVLRVLETPAQILELIRKAKRSIWEVYTETLAENGLSHDELVVWLTYQETDLTYKYKYNTAQLIEMIPKVAQAKKDGFDLSVETLTKKIEEYRNNLRKSKDNNNDTNTGENK